MPGSHARSMLRCNEVFEIYAWQTQGDCTAFEREKEKRGATHEPRVNYASKNLTSKDWMAYAWTSATAPKFFE